ncbi:MAG: hypothetical protein V7K88_17345 [Nostoc sp.]
MSNILYPIPSAQYPMPNTSASAPSSVRVASRREAEMLSTSA